MKILTKVIAVVLCALMMPAMEMSAQGWPANYGGVMLQGFYWDSYTASQWTRLERNADELSRYFSLIWVPQSGNCGDGQSMGYDPKYYWNQNSSFGTEEDLRSMISALKQRGTGVIADVVINHRGNLTSWVDFPAETYKGVTYQMKSTDICKDDDGGACKAWADQNGYQLSSYNDSGEGWAGMRDLDHNSSNVQTIVKAYLDYLKNDLGYAGFRYDMVKGYSSSFTGLYNSAVGADYSIGEYWDGSAAMVNTWISGTKVNDVIQSAAFDFAFRYSCRDAVNGVASSKLPGATTTPNWSKLATATTSATNKIYQRYAITFVENHDVEYRSASAPQDPIIRDTLALNAWMMANPGTPCVFYKHWIDCKKDIKLMIEARRLVGITNQSVHTNASAKTNVVARRVQGTNGYLMVVVGDVSAYTAPSGYTKLLEGKNYAYYVSSDCNKSSWDATVKRIEEESVEEPFEPYDVTVYVRTKMPAAFKEGTLNFWAWDDKKNLTQKGAWPGDAVTQTVQKGGETWFYQTYTITSKDNAVNCVFSSGTGTPQTIDVTAITEDRYFSISEKMSGAKYMVDEVELPEDSEPLPAQLAGGDISVLPLYEQHNSGYLDADGNKIDDLIKWLKDECGWNAFRVRLFVDPKAKDPKGNKDLCVVQNLDYVKKLGKRIKDAGGVFLLDFHYSDTWADPSYQTVPEAWGSLSDDEMAAKVREYTAECMKALRSYGAKPDYVQIGNEITYGMLKRSTSDMVNPSQSKSAYANAWARMSKLLNAAASAVRATSNAKIIVHTERSGQASQTVNFYNYISDVDYDIVGLSYYPFYHGNISALSTTLTQLGNALPKKQVQIVETSYPFQYYPGDAKYDYQTTWPATADGQYKFTQDLIAELEKHSNVNGIYWWQPEEAGNGDDSDWSTGGSGATVMSGWMTRGMWWCDQKTTGHWPVVSSNGFVGNLLGTYAKNATVLLGDANGDGTISVADLAMMASYILEGSAEGINTVNADANVDGTISVADLSLVASLILGL